jgi:tRNA dimethylallyltransferase
MTKPKIAVIVGATASGKTSAGIALAGRLNGEIISADSMQIYREMAIGTAKPTPAERAAVPHHLVDFVPPDTAYSVAAFKDDAQAVIKAILSRERVPIVVGGTGLYINALTLPWDFAEPASDPAVREALEARYDTEGAEALYRELETLDPAAAEKIHPHNKKRIVRAMEVYQVTGKTKSAWEARARQIELPYDFVMMGIGMARSELYARIDHRVDQMMAGGLLDEVSALLDAGYGPELLSMQAIGYKELIPAVRGERPLTECVHILKRDTRHFAKRQLTWFRRDRRIRWYDPADYASSEAMAAAMQAQYNTFSSPTAAGTVNQTFGKE